MKNAVELALRSRVEFESPRACKDTNECCLGWKHAQEALAQTSLCDHCFRLGSTSIGCRADFVEKIGAAGKGSSG
jgi:hypothetical protein